MKLLYITNGINGAGGLERVLSIKASYLADHYNYDVSILSLNDNHLNPFYEFSEKIRMVSISVSGSLMKYASSYIKGIKDAVRQVNPDVISVCDDGLKGFFVPKILTNKIPIIYERHASVNLNFKRNKSSPISSIQGKLQYALMKYFANTFDKFIVLTNGNLKEWQGNNLQVIPNPLSFYPKACASLEANSVIAVGSHSYNKGYDLLLLAWKKVVNKYPDWKLEIYGKIDHDKTYLQLAEKLGIQDRVEFFNPVKDIHKKYLKSSIMVLPSRSEGFGMVLIEAMACGVPCVSFDCPHGPADIIEDDIDGFLVENENIEAFASKIMKLMKDQELRKRMGVTARENAERFRPEFVLKQWDELFKSLIH